MLSARGVGWLLALVATLLYSTNTPIARGVILAGMAPTTLVVGRFTSGALLFAIVLIATRLGKTRASEVPLDRRHSAICLIAGALNGLTLAFFYSALVSMNASLSHLLSVAIFPLATLLFLALRGERLTGWKIGRLVIAFLGLFLLLGVSGQPNAGGLVYVLLAASAYGLHLAMVQWYLKPFNTWLIAGVMMSAAAVVVFIYWLLAGADTYVAGWHGWAAILYQGAVLTFIGRVVIYESINRIGSGQFALLAPVETLLTILWSALFLSEGLVPVQWVGAIFILGSALMAAEWRGRRERPVAKVS